MNRPEAEPIASAITMLRPDWPYTSLMTLLGRYQHRTARDVMLALVWVAFDPETKTPGRIDADGPWWGITRLAGLPEPTLTPPTAEQIDCRIHNDSSPCRGCAADAKAIEDEQDDTTTPDRQPGESLRDWAARIAQGDES